MLFVRRGEENVGVQKKNIHLPSALGLVVRDLVGIETELSHFLSGVFIVLGVDGVAEKEFGNALRRVDLDGKCDGRTEEHPVLPRFRDDQRALFQAVSPSKASRNDDGAALPDLGRFLVCHTDIQNIRLWNSRQGT